MDLSERLRIAEDRSRDPYERLARYEEIVELMHECIDAMDEWHFAKNAAGMRRGRKRWEAACAALGIDGNSS